MLTLCMLGKDTFFLFYPETEKKQFWLLMQCIQWRQFAWFQNRFSGEKISTILAEGVLKVNRSIQIIFFLISPGKRMLWLLLGAPRWGASNEYPQHIFSWRNKKNISIFRLEQVPCLELWIIFAVNMSWVFFRKKGYNTSRRIWLSYRMQTEKVQIALLNLTRTFSVLQYCLQ